MTKSVLITGTSSGIGRDAALYLNQRDYLVLAGVRHLPDGARVKERAANPDMFVPILLDVTRQDQVDAAVATVRSHVGVTGLDALISNAGIAAVAPPASCEQTPLVTQQEVMDTNFFGAVRVIQAFLPLLRSSRGTIIVNSALMAHTVIPFNGGYAASKCALEGWADSLRREVRPFGIRVAMIEAGYITTEIENKQREAPAGTSSAYPVELGLHRAALAAAPRLAGRASASPRRVSEAMLRAAEARHPAPRRVVGAGASLVWAIGCLPDRLQDLVFDAVLTRLAHRSERSSARSPGAQAVRPRHDLSDQDGTRKGRAR